MSGGTWSIERVRTVDELLCGELIALLRAVVDGGASVGFLAPLAEERARAFWERIAREVGEERRVLVVARDEHGLCGTVQLVLDLPENQPHRADLVKLLVAERCRRLGLGRALVLAVEGIARELGRDLLVLDAVTEGPAARLYAALGWVRVGEVPRFALMPAGEPCSTTYFYRDLSGGGRAPSGSGADAS